ncbi:MAG: sec-independent protein translocase protein TatC [Alphaproteobacteria bacterium]|jgi:sec-independent protein translocase protein TatC
MSEQVQTQAVHKTPLVAHLVELRRRMMIACFVIVAGAGACYLFKEQVFLFLVRPLAGASNPPLQMIYTGVPELFFTYLRLSFFTGLFVALPIILWEIWAFVAPGLYKNERRVIAPFIAATPVLFYAGGSFMYFIVMPLAMSFFFGFQTDTITALPSVKEYLAFLIKMLFAFGFAFELPVLLLLLMKFGVVSVGAVKRFRRYAIVCIFIASALLTPPDPVSQLILAVPLVLLYELSIFMAKFLRIKDK